jgi:holdfast attachment protein HfaA
MTNMLKTAGIAVLFATAAMGAANAGDFSNAANYNTAYGMYAGEENATVNPSLRDANGNLQVVNGQFQSSTMAQQSGVQNMSGLGAGGMPSGVGYGSTTGTASAVGNSLNVVTVGNNNTVVVNSSQINNGNQTATTTINNGH